MANKRDSITEDVSIISSGVKIDGNLYSDGNVRIDGSIKGNISVSGNLTIGDVSEIYGEVKAKNITMSGKVLGKINSLEKLKLESKAYLKGDLITKFLIIEEGAHFEGFSSMNNGVSSEPKEE
ncbi:MAG: polymer-forming cytoskeletal protein [Ignavibacteriales bacterium]|nr:polymer-forming cytoskeletal protein [Ignavibacteriales bacterium]